MKNVLLFGVIVFCLIILCVNLNAVETVKNPQGPTDKSAGKVIKTQDILRITDESGRFFFKYIMAVKTSPDGCIFVKDKREMLKLSADGKFIRNFYNHGQGPGEALYIGNFIVNSKELIVHDSRQNKVLIFDHLNGNLLSEFRVYAPGTYHLIASNGGKFYFVHNVIPETRGKAKLHNIEKQMIAISSKGEVLERLSSFPTQYFICKAGDQYFSDMRVDFLICNGGSNKIFVSHTPKYKITLYDYVNNEILRSFSRDYDRIETDDANRQYAPGGNFGKISIDGKQFKTVPVDEYLPDIQRLLHHNDELWVITSTLVKPNKLLVDVFNKEGKYISNFYFILPKYVIPFRINYWIKWVSGDYLFTSEQDKEGNRFLKKSKILVGEK